MKSYEYRELIRKIVRSSLRRKLPGIKGYVGIEIQNEIAKAIHARFYGANVDGVESPLWRDEEPTEITAKEIMEQS